MLCKFIFTSVAEQFFCFLVILVMRRAFGSYKIDLRTFYCSENVSNCILFLLIFLICTSNHLKASFNMHPLIVRCKFQMNLSFQADSILICKKFVSRIIYFNKLIQNKNLQFCIYDFSDLIAIIFFKLNLKLITI